MTTTDSLLRLRKLLGERLLRFLLACPEDVDLDGYRQAQQHVLEALEERAADLGEEASRLPASLARTNGDTDLPLSWELHCLSGGTLPVPLGADQLGLALSEMARDLYCVLLSDPGELRPTWFGRVVAPPEPILPFEELARGHRLADHATELLQQEPRGPDGALLVSAMSVIKVDDCLEISSLLHTAAGQWRCSKTADAQAFMAATVKSLTNVRDVIATGTKETRACIGFSGLPLPAGATATLPFGRLRAVTRSEESYAPLELVADAVLETPVRATLVLAGENTSTHQMQEQDRLARAGREVCLAAALAKPAHLSGTCPAVAWTIDLTPPGPFRVWRPPEPASHWGRGELVESQELHGIEHWTSALANVDLGHIEVAIVRLLRALWGRDDTDSLIDAVIAWEGLVGSRPDTTFRVTAALAVLCEEDVTLRIRRQKELAKVYDVRSRLVHGDTLTGAQPARECAVETALQALRTLIDDRPDLLSLKDSSDRAKRLLLGIG